MSSTPDNSLCLCSAKNDRKTAAGKHTGRGLCFAAVLSFLIFDLADMWQGNMAVHAQTPGVAATSQQSSTALLQALLPMMENPRNPLLEISSSEGDIYLELFPDAAPLNVRRVLELVNGQLAPSSAGSYYNGLTFHRVIPGHFLQTGAAERADRMRPAPIADEINARGLGLEQQRLLDAAGKPHSMMNIADLADFQSRVLSPLYRNMNINSPDQLIAQQERVTQRLRDTNLMQIHELAGYRYNGALPSRRPLSGSVMMVNRGPGTNDGELLLSLVDAPWLTATHTVIGRVVSGLTLATSISRQPEASVRIYHIHQLDTSSVVINATDTSTLENNNNVQIQP
ncbi:MAG: peptidylprolyl isomerase [Pseudohongiella sp.]|nr:peptidylprolyl isomerase [Pseudohongiella sp.]